MPRKKIEITVYCKDREVYVPGGRVRSKAFEEYILDDPEVQEACNRPIKRRWR
jgi:hypothetical protein